MLNYSRDHPVSDSLNYMATWQAGMLQQEDLREAMAAQKEKRAPEFEDIWPRETATKAHRRKRRESRILNH